MARITKKSALVTGGATAVGSLVAEELANMGWTVALHYFAERSRADATAARIRRNGGAAEIFQANLAREVEVDHLVETVCARIGSLSLLVHAAAVAEDDTVASATRHTWDRHMEANVRAPFVLAQHLSAQLPETDEGNIVLLVDQRAPAAMPHYLSYSLSQAALATLTRSLALGLSPRIRVNAIGPSAPMPGDVVLPKPGDPGEELCRTLRFILGTPCVTGQILALDGGDEMGWIPLDISARSAWLARSE